MERKVFQTKGGARKAFHKIAQQFSPEAMHVGSVQTDVEQVGDGIEQWGLRFSFDLSVGELPKADRALVVENGHEVYFMHDAPHPAPAPKAAPKAKADKPAGPAKPTKKGRVLELLAAEGGVTVPGIAAELEISKPAASSLIQDVRRDGSTVTRFKPEGATLSHYKLED